MLPHWLDLMGIAVGAIGGTLAAGRKSLDLVGVIIIAMIASVGGGTLRDLLLDRNPVFWMRDSDYMLVILLSSLSTLLYLRYRPMPKYVLEIADAIALAIYAILGARIAESFGVTPIIMTVLGVITGVFGGMLRDVLVNEIPFILNQDFYASAAIIGIVVYWGMKQLGLHAEYSAYIGVITIIVLRLAAMYFKWKLPVFHIQH
ncbi:MAG: hypothetical protein RLZZ422_247 [Pseudomonadota bacterium]|jgi:uncharacterized membrane protein YeiH